MIFKNFNLIDKIKKIFSQSAVFVQNHNKLIFIVLIFLAFLAAGIIFYKYNYNIPSSQGIGKEKEVEINYELYQKILKRIEERTKEAEEAKNKTYPDPFK